MKARRDISEWSPWQSVMAENSLLQAAQRGIVPDVSLLDYSPAFHNAWTSSDLYYRLKSAKEGYILYR